jgi:hypothetical protein
MIQAGDDTNPRVIYAYGHEVPSSSAVDAHLVMHTDHGFMQFRFAKDPTTSTFVASSASSPSSTSAPSLPPPNRPPHHAPPVTDIPLLRFQRYIVVHAVFCTLGFLVLLPAGVFLARYLRTFTPTWFQGHWIIQFAIGVSDYFYLLCRSLIRVFSWAFHRHGLCVRCSRSVQDRCTPS